MSATRPSAVSTPQTRRKRITNPGVPSSGGARVTAPGAGRAGGAGEGEGAAAGRAPAGGGAPGIGPGTGKGRVFGSRPLAPAATLGSSCVRWTGANAGGAAGAYAGAGGGAA